MPASMRRSLGSFAPARVDVVIGEPTADTGVQVVGRVAELLEQGVAPQDILVLAANTDAALRLGGRLAQAGCAEVAARSVRFLCLEILADPAARAATGRTGRLLAPFEEDLVLEDLKTCGMKPRRLRGMVGYIYRGWTELSDDDPAWLQGDEVPVAALLQKILGFSGGIAQAEVSRLALKALQSDEALRARWQAKHVLVDGFASIQRASQAVAATLARVSLFAAGDPARRAPLLESTPYTEGLAELAADRPDARVTHMASEAVSSVAGLACQMAHAQPGEDSDALCLGPEVATVGFATPAEEMGGVVRLVQDALERGVEAAEIYVGAPNRVWASNAARALRAADVDVAEPVSCRVLVGDVRSAASRGAFGAFALLALAADPTDAVALRSWCALGDDLAGSLGCAALRETYGEAGMLAAVEREAQDPCKPGHTGQVVAAWREGMRRSGRLAGLTGEALVETLFAEAGVAAGDAGRQTRRALGHLWGPVGPHDDAQVLFGRLLARLADPSFGEAQGVRVGTLEACVGAEAVVACGVMNGFVPEHVYFDRTVVTIDKQARLWRQGLDRLYALASSAVSSVAFTYCTEVGLEEAGKLDLKVERIGLKEGRRVCRVDPSIYLAQLNILGRGGEL